MSTSCYTGQCVVVFGTASLQRYIFHSNRLKENVGASYLAKRCIEMDLIETTRHAGYHVYTDGWNKYQQASWDKNDTNSIPQPETVNQNGWREPVNLIYVGGGNAALLCKNKDIAQKIVRKWSHELLKAAPGVRVVVGYGVVESSLANAYRVALDDLFLCEETLPFGSHLGSLPVVRTCPTTGLPASFPSREPYENNQWISTDTDRKRDAAQHAITDELKSVLNEGQQYAIKPEDELGGREGESHIAVVHADGNGMGKLLNDVIDESGQTDTDFLHNLRSFSASVSRQSLRSLLTTLKCLQDSLPRLQNDLAVDTSKFFPLRPIVYGGDDLTFVCDGRLGLNLAALYLEEFAKEEIYVLGEWKPVSACAGVVIVPTKYPFVRAYNFADELCGMAKRHRRMYAYSEGNWLDFQIIQEGSTQSISDLRDTQYKSLTGHTLHQRPYKVPDEWENFTEILKGFESSEWPRSRAKGLLHALARGKDATKHFIDAAAWRKVKMPCLNSMLKTTCESGWETDDTTPYFDPLEALDFYLEFRPTSEAENDDVEEKVE